jgi:nicotinamidase-related amidase
MTALLLIDIQLGLGELDYYGGERNNPGAETHCRKLLDHFRAQHLPVFHVKNNSVNKASPLHPDKPGNAINPLVKPIRNEAVIEKSANSAFIGTDLGKQLEDAGISGIVIAGLTTEHCISATARSASDLGFRVWVVSDATAAFNKDLDGNHYPADLVHKIALANLKDEFAEICSTNEVIQHLLK